MDRDCKTRPWLPEERERSRSGVGALTSMVLGLCVFLGANAGAGHLLRNVGTNLGYSLMDQKWAILEKHDGPIDWLIVGDSSGNQGAVPGVIADRLGGPNGGTTLNLCTIGDVTAVHSAWMVQAFIERHGPPAEGVIVVQTYDIWRRWVRPEPFARVGVPIWKWASMDPGPGFNTRPDGDKTVRGEWRRALLARYFPLYSEDVTLKSLLSDPKSTWPRYHAPKEDDWRTVNATGFLPLRGARPALVERDAGGHLRYMRFQEFAMSPPNAEAVDRLVDIADEHQFDIFFANGPLYEGFFDPDAAIYSDFSFGPERFAAYIGALREHLEHSAARSPRAHVVLGDPVKLGIDQMQNADHATLSGARRYTRQLVRAIQEARSIEH